jgi:hypothetical protein
VIAVDSVNNSGEPFRRGGETEIDFLRLYLSKCLGQASDMRKVDDSMTCYDPLSFEEVIRTYAFRSVAVFQAWCYTLNLYPKELIVLAFRDIEKCPHYGIRELARCVDWPKHKGKKGGIHTEERGSAHRQSSEVAVSKEALAIALLSKDPGLTMSALASEVGVSRTTLYSWDQLRKVRGIIKAKDRDYLPRGLKGADGKMEAWVGADD